MFGIGVQCFGVAGVGLQDGVQVHRRLLAVAQPVAVQRRQLALQLEAELRLCRLFQLPFAQLGQFAEILTFQVQRRQFL